MYYCCYLFYFIYHLPLTNKRWRVFAAIVYPWAHSPASPQPFVFRLPFRWPQESKLAVVTMSQVLYVFSTSYLYVCTCLLPSFSFSAAPRAFVVNARSGLPASLNRAGFCFPSPPVLFHGSSPLLYSSPPTPRLDPSLSEFEALRNRCFSNTWISESATEFSGGAP